MSQFTQFRIIIRVVESVGCYLLLDSIALRTILLSYLDISIME